MLDKSVSYFDIIMRRDNGLPLPVYNLPIGYRYSFYRAGDEKAWADIEASVLEFSDESAALSYFVEDYLPYVSSPEKRCLFVCNAHGEKIATSTAGCCCPKHRAPWLHWVAVKPKYQGLGIGKALVSEITRIMIELDGDRDFYLHTQTWSHRAIRIYQKIGYVITKERNLCEYVKFKNDDYEQALAVLDKLKLD